MADIEIQWLNNEGFDSSEPLIEDDLDLLHLDMDLDDNWEIITHDEPDLDTLRREYETARIQFEKDNHERERRRSAATNFITSTAYTDSSIDCLKYDIRLTPEVRTARIQVFDVLRMHSRNHYVSVCGFGSM